MSLNWDLSDIENAEEICWVPDGKDGGYTLNTITETLIWSTIIVSLNQITEANAEEFYRRLTEYEVISGGLMVGTTKEGERIERMPTLKEIQNHIGLTTNVDNKSKREWTALLNYLVKQRAKDARHRQAEVEYI